MVRRAAPWLLACAVVGGLLGGCYFKFEFDSGDVSPPLVITRPPQSTTVIAPQPAAFDVVATGTGRLTYQWQRNGQAVIGANRPAYATPPTTPADDGSLFTVTVCDESTCTTSLPALLTVLRGQ